MNIEDIKSKLKEKKLDFIILKINNKIISANILKDKKTIGNFENEDKLISYLT